MKTIDVIFRKWKDGSILALFPHCVDTYEGSVISYEHTGQHSSADYGHCIYNTKPAKEHEYKPLKAELESIGYNLNVIKRQNYNKFLLGLNEIRQTFNQYGEF